ncbi:MULTISPECIES: hypothetical protein [unclassified Paraburkholderia]|uniref:hypothetical protein n=1 Tax=unclassified Paraburkholderia TaxID=2615204 RepID=UPI002AB0DF59|nr:MULTISPECIES: hypothetical protein [unclassified Paraburkholderia]
MAYLRQCRACPFTTPQWIPGGAPTVLIGSMLALDMNATLVRMWAGIITVVQPAQTSVLIP